MSVLLTEISSETNKFQGLKIVSFVCISHLKLTSTHLAFSNFSARGCVMYHVEVICYVPLSGSLKSNRNTSQAKHLPLFKAV